MIISHHASDHHTTHHTSTKTKSSASTSTHTTALSSLRLAIHALLWITTIPTTHHRLLSIHALLLRVAATHHWLLTIALLSVALLRISTATILLLLRSRAAAAELSGDLGHETTLLFARRQLALLAVWTGAALLL
jgi:hypothetical protein